MSSIKLHGLATSCTVTFSGSRADELGDAVLAAWTRCLHPIGGEIDAGEIRVVLGGEGEPQPDDVDLTGIRLDVLLQELTQLVTMRYIAAQTGRLFMLHAGAVAHPETGDAIAFVAPGGTGKTTMARLMGKRYGYLSDETVGFTADGTIKPYPKPLSVRPPDFNGIKHELSPDALGLQPTPNQAKVRRVVLLDRRPEATVPTVTPLDVISALTELSPESSALSALPRPLHTLAALLDELPPTVRLTYAEATDVVDVVAELLEDGS